MFCAYLIENGSQSSTVRSYVSAIKNILRDDGYNWNEDRILLQSFIGACKMENDKFTCRLPIQVGLLEVLLFELERMFHSQFYLEKLYKAIFALMYYGLMRIGEVVQGSHTLKAKDMHISQNKNKMLIVLYSSKTHSKANLPQKIKITDLEQYPNNQKDDFSVHSNSFMTMLA